MNGIIKRRLTSNYAQIHNGALQTLEDVRSIGLISHLMSLPETWVISKMQLYSKFGRGPITNAIKELEAKKYWVSITYRDGKKTLYYYNVSDVAFDDSHVLTMIDEVKQGGFKITAISESFGHLISIGENQQLKKADNPKSVDSSIVGNEQLMVNNAHSTVENRHLINKYEQINKEKQHKDKGNIVNLQGIDNFLNPIQFKVALIDACNSYYSEFAPSRWSKQAWLTLIETFVNETIENERYIKVPEAKINSYAYASLKNMAHKVDFRNGKIELSSSGKVPFYDWINNVEDDEMPY
ncbi:hypothetical protein [Neobacillus mesonae]|uniref:Uncharacterized protein n=1 Tax=Neobacillus mesonae TaxID=1193713 RepID=A0A3T0HSJ9_9BACI|nr:hypothetical protein [Neobacillus mesonae]AZU60094.1 hypothetical protein CHR53_01775 [Neobacillus mesonae]